MTTLKHAQTNAHDRGRLKDFFRTAKPTALRSYLLEKETVLTGVCGTYAVVGKPVQSQGISSIYPARGSFRSCIIKIPNLDNYDTEHDRQRMQFLLLEGLIVATMAHKNIVHIIDGGLHDGMPFLVLERLEETVSSPLSWGFIRRSPPLAANYMCQVADALTEVHARKIVHLDVKPGNILLASSYLINRVKLIDFGLAVPCGTEIGVPRGSQEYMAPEQVRGGVVDERTDVYGMGASLYELLCGIPPFTASDYYEKTDCLPPLPSSRVPHGTLIPQGLEAVAMKALSLDPSGRYQSAEAFKYALLSAVSL